MEYKVNLYFSCDFESENKKKSKTYIESLLCNNDKESKCMFRYSSPIFSANKFSIGKSKINFDKDSGNNTTEKDNVTNKLNVGNDNQKEKRLLYKCERRVIWDIFDSCNMLDYIDNTIRLKFTVSHYLYPYGIGLHALLNESEINSILEIIRTYFIPFSKDKANEKRENLEWIIYDKPLIVIEPYKHQSISNEMNIHSDFCPLSYPEMKVAATNDVVAFLRPRDENSCELDSVLAIFIVLRNLSYNARLKSKQLAPQYKMNRTKKKETVNQIHMSCAVFDEIDNPNIFYTEKEQILYRELRNKLGVQELKNQICAARESVDFWFDQTVGNKADKINDTLFITGYIGLLLSFLAFAPIELRNLVPITKTLEQKEKIVSCLALIVIVVLLIILSRKMYLLMESLVEKYVVVKRKWINCLLNVLSFLLPIALMVYIIFAFFVNGYITFK